MTALHDFIHAAASFYGVPGEQLTDGCTLDTSNGDIEVVLRVALTAKDVTDIAQRMQRMALEREVDAQMADLSAVPVPIPGVAELRKAYNALSLAERSKYGSFARFRAMGGVLPEPPAVFNLAPRPGQSRDEWVSEVRAAAGLPSLADVLLAEKADLPPHVYLSPSEATEQQKAMAVGRDAQGRYAVDPADLTEQQRARHVTGITSDAADFGGLPG